MRSAVPQCTVHNETPPKYHRISKQAEEGVKNSEILEPLFEQRHIVVKMKISHLNTNQYPTQLTAVGKKGKKIQLINSKCKIN